MQLRGRVWVEGQGADDRGLGLVRMAGGGQGLQGPRRQLGAAGVQGCSAAPGSLASQCRAWPGTARRARRWPAGTGRPGPADRGGRQRSLSGPWVQGGRSRREGADAGMRDTGKDGSPVKDRGRRRDRCRPVHGDSQAAPWQHGQRTTARHQERALGFSGRPQRSTGPGTHIRIRGQGQAGAQGLEGRFAGPELAGLLGPGARQARLLGRAQQPVSGGKPGAGTPGPPHGKRRDRARTPRPRCSSGSHVGAPSHGHGGLSPGTAGQRHAPA